MTRSPASRTVSIRFCLTVQVTFAASFVLAWLLMPITHRVMLQADLRGPIAAGGVDLTEREPARVQSLYDDPSVIRDEDLAAVLTKLLPRFDTKQLRPNYVEHALRIWGARIEFTLPDLISGPEMVRFLTDSSRYQRSWGNSAEPILSRAPNGVDVLWGPDRALSVHHDHLAACLTEAGVTLDTPVFPPQGPMEFRDLMQEAFMDFRLDEREVEWSAMAFGCWLAPQRQSQWRNSQQRELSFDLLAERLMRSDPEQGVCLGTHRVYSLVLLLRLNEAASGELLPDDTVRDIASYVSRVRDLIQSTPTSDGSWPPDWTKGAAAADPPAADEKPYRRVISTGHHLEWLAMAPAEFHPPRDRIRAAAAWAVRDVRSATPEYIADNYTYYSHVANALALWRGTTPPEFWLRWRAEYPECESLADRENITQSDVDPQSRSRDND